MVTAALSDGTGIAPANHGQKALRALRKAQRALARKTHGSANRRKAVRRIARIQMRVANARKDFLHKHSTIIAKTHGVVGVEGLPVRSLSASATGTVAEPGRRVRQKAGLNRAILDQGWGLFRTLLADKVADRGGKLVEVPAAHTSQTCACCVWRDNQDGERDNQDETVWGRGRSMIDAAVGGFQGSCRGASIRLELIVAREGGRPGPRFLSSAARRR
ncbi:transposase [Azospirillum sp. A1-3]|uniref:RNA-guided endonuclease InsQ/TnpB family protein n=1 Tax=Azospirillum sp. A1-3 TaxID=185874 RepID=UPI00207784E5|nr:transposase [Azospirillum sp. A1-3]MCM8738541.1 transposase [Azospirillum sp. A1-3]